MRATEAHEDARFIDCENRPTPTEGILVTYVEELSGPANSLGELIGGVADKRQRLVRA